LQIFDAPATRLALPLQPLIAALERLFISGCEVPTRHVHTITTPTGQPLTSLLMTAWQPGGCYGVKTVNVAPDNAAKGLPGVFASYTLFDATTGQPLALIDGSELTARRTAAASALAARFLARPDATRLTLVGAGRVAALLPAAHRCVRPIREVRVWNHRAAGAQALVQALQQQGFAAQAVTDLREAVQDSDIVSCATLATEPLVHGPWLAAGSHLDLIGSFTPQMREADDDCWRTARVVVDTMEALQKSGDLLGPIAQGAFAPQDLCGTLADLCRGTAPGRQSASERTVFKSVGTALEDLAAALLVVGR
jgi:ornithine cyclodeaminase